MVPANPCEPPNAIWLMHTYFGGCENEELRERRSCGDESYGMAQKSICTPDDIAIGQFRDDGRLSFPVFLVGMVFGRHSLIIVTSV